MKTRMISERNTVTTCSALIVEVYLCVDEVGGGGAVFMHPNT